MAAAIANGMGAFDRSTVWAARSAAYADRVVRTTHVAFGF